MGLAGGARGRQKKQYGLIDVIWLQLGRRGDESTGRHQTISREKWNVWYRIIEETRYDGELVIKTWRYKSNKRNINNRKDDWREILKETNMLSVNNIKISSNVLINWYYLLGASKCDMWLNYGDNNSIWDKSRCHQMKLLLQPTQCVKCLPLNPAGEKPMQRRHSWSSSIESLDRISHKLEISPSSIIAIKMSLTKSDNWILFADVHRYAIARRHCPLSPLPKLTILLWEI